MAPQLGETIQSIIENIPAFFTEIQTLLNEQMDKYQGVAHALGDLTIFRFPYALLIGVLIAFTALIPIVGAFIGCFIGALLMLMVSPAKMILFIIIFLVLQQVEGNFIYPRVVGNSIGLPAIWVLAAVTIGGSLMGIAGMLIFIPLVSVLYTLLRDAVRMRVKKRQIKPEKYGA